jgi:hypothetical protein
MKLMDAESLLTVACAQITFYVLIRVAMVPTFAGNTVILQFFIIYFFY